MQHNHRENESSNFTTLVCTVNCDVLCFTFNPLTTPYGIAVWFESTQTCRAYFNLITSEAKQAR